MEIICGWCKKDLGDKAPFDDKSITYGICDDCLARQLDNIDVLKARQAIKNDKPVNTAA